MVDDCDIGVVCSKSTMGITPELVIRLRHGYTMVLQKWCYWPKTPIYCPFPPHQQNPLMSEPIPKTPFWTRCPTIATTKYYGGLEGKGKNT